MKKQDQKTQFNMREFLESKEYIDKKNEIAVEINSFSIEPIKLDRNTKDEIKKVKKIYNKLKKDSEAMNIIKKSLIESFTNTFFKQPRFNFILKV